VPGEREESAVTGTDAGAAAPRAGSRVRKLGVRLLALAVLAVVGYLGWQAYGHRVVSGLTAGSPEQPAAAPGPATAPAASVAALAALRERVDNQDREREQLRTALTALKTEFDRETSARQVAVPDSDTLAVMEVEHLLRLASQRLWEARSAASALALLERADTLLAPLTDPGLEPVRAALVADMTALKLAGSVDVEGLYLRLSALQTAIATLNPAPRPVSMPAADGVAPAAAPPCVGVWPRLWSNAGAALRRFSAEHLRVRTLEAPPPALLSRAQEARLQQYLELLLSQAQLAVLARQERIYRDSLARAVQLLDAHFGFDARTPALRAELVGLQTEPVALPLPDISSSRERVREYLARDQQRRAGAAPR
jgi:uroporphyrin-3 C-methyltransferase